MTYEAICTMLKDMFKYGKVTPENTGYNQALMDALEKVGEMEWQHHGRNSMELTGKNE